MKLDNSKMKVENLKLKSQPEGIMVKWKSAKLIPKNVQKPRQ